MDTLAEKSIKPTKAIVHVLLMFMIKYAQEKYFTWQDSIVVESIETNWNFTYTYTK